MFSWGRGRRGVRLGEVVGSKLVEGMCIIFFPTWRIALRPSCHHRLAFIFCAIKLNIVIDPMNNSPL